MLLTVHAKAPGKLRLTALIEIARNVVSAVRHYEAKDAHTTPSDWFIVSTKMTDSDTLSLTLRPDSPDAAIAADEYVSDLRGVLTRRGGHRLSGAALSRTNQAARLLDDGIANFTIRTPKRKKVDVTPALASKVQSLAKGVYRERTSIDGFLKRIDWDERKPIFYIENRFTGYKTRCVFDTYLLESVKKALAGRVRVEGFAKFNKNGDIVRMDVSGFTPIPSDNSLPQLKDMHDVNLTNGEDPFMIIERARHG